MPRVARRDCYSRAVVSALVKAPLFPLPDGALLPGEFLSLHVFEPRYRAMLEDARKGSPVIAIATLLPGWEADYAGTPAVADIVGLGRMVKDRPQPDGTSDIVEQALQRPPNQFQAPPLTLERDAAGTRVVLGSRPRNLQGWTVTIEQSTDLRTWTPSPAAATTTTPNPDGTSDRISVLLPAGGSNSYVRLKVTLPP